MGDESPVSVSTEQHASVVPQPTSTTTSVIADDEEPEPPSPRSPARPAQVNRESESSRHLRDDNYVEGMVDNNASLVRERKTNVIDQEKQALTRIGDAPAGHGIPRARMAELSKRDRFKALFTPHHVVGPPPTYTASIIATIKYTPLNVFLICVPVSWALHYSHQSPVIIFIFAALGILPLAALLGLGTEQIALRTSQSVGGLLNATLGNVVELIVAGIALSHCDLELVQSSLLGGLLSNLLLVLGMAFVAGGYRFHQQEFQPIVAQLNLSLMTLSVITLLVPAAFHEFLGQRLQEGEEGPILLQLSRGTAVILMLIYVAYLFFQFYSHSHLFVDTVQQPSSRRSSASSTSSSSFINSALPLPATTNFEHAEKPRLNVPFALCLLAAVTGLAYLTAEFLVDALDDVAESAPFSKEFLTLIIIPIISNAAEHTTAVVVASKGKFDLALGVAVGSCIQIALFVIPVLVLAAWGVGKPLTLVFDPLETLCLFFSVLLVKFSVEDGKAHWMSGVVLVAVYVVIALSFWNFPDNLGNDIGLVCS